MSTSRKTFALVSGIAICLAVMTPFVLAINQFDWGVGLVFVSPLVIWLLLRVCRRLERWARNETETLPPDPDYPDDPD
jgi:hypothetical protein